MRNLLRGSSRNLDAWRKLDEEGKYRVVEQFVEKWEEEGGDEAIDFLWGVFEDIRNNSDVWKEKLKITGDFIPPIDYSKASWPYVCRQYLEDEGDAVLESLVEAISVYQRGWSVLSVGARWKLIEKYGTLKEVYKHNGIRFLRHIIDDVLSCVEYWKK